ncbi:uncharacterized protein TM35_000163010 [Trypanosoma theileri]|uniref:Uncharacterized protein n=1 Tax=Trypanosoma theileri TaxID=67003 RepID=A0A1X0NW08_9TRYP|nr:uncharacterized protein TM35_000163010 [Trypanosoma theileri]ORC88663.1 hypothetical protein TM35_000163010 [Trypanosoma theileri]
MVAHLLPPVHASLSLRLLDCSSCALIHTLQQKRITVPSQSLAQFALDILTGAVVVGGATEVLVPFSLLKYVHDFFKSTSADRQRREAWDTLAMDDRLVILTAPRDVPRLIAEFPRYTQVCMCVPTGPLCSRMLFDHTPLETFFSEHLTPAMTALSEASPREYRCTAWLRSSLSCRFEGPHVPAVRVAETAARLLGGAHGCCCERVVYEEGVAGVTPRAVETAVAAAAACGVGAGRMVLAVCRGGAAGDLVARAVGVGSGGAAVCAAPAPLFPHSEELMGPSDVLKLACGWNDVSGQLSDEELASLEDSIEYSTTLAMEWEAWLKRWGKETNPSP